MPLHQIIQRALLLGVRLPPDPPPPQSAAPPRLQPLIDAFAARHREFDARAVRYGDRYRSGFWAIYVLSAFAVLCAMLPLALGWDHTYSDMHPFAGFWVVAEVFVIGTVCIIFWRGQKTDWQSEWLRARTTAELVHYLPLVAPLIDFSKPSSEPNWYLRLLDPGQHVRGTLDVTQLCVANEQRARELLDGAWSDPTFITSYARWAIDTFESQRHYHSRVAARSHALLHRIHRITIGLFVLTALGALAHLVLHSIWLSLVTTVSPALAASLHGALAQSEAYRLHATSERVAAELNRAIDKIRQLSAVASPDVLALKAQVQSTIESLKEEVHSTIATLLDEHQDWHMLVRPHGLPLA
jgi:hypothetical protein